MKIKNTIAAICGVILIACMAAGLPVFAAETDDVVYLDIDGDGQISQAEIDYAVALKAMQDFQARYEARAAAGIYSDELLVPEDALGNEGLTAEAVEATLENAGAAEETSAEDTTAETAAAIPAWDGSVLNKIRGTVNGPSGREVYYNLNMTPVIEIAQQRGIPGSFWVREDGVKMYGNYVMVAANYNLHPYGSLLETSLGTAIVLDTGGFAQTMPTLIDVAVRW